MRKLAASLVLSALSVSAQTPIQVTPCRQGAEPHNLPVCSSGPPNYSAIFQESLRQHAAVIESQRQAALQQQQTDLQRQFQQQSLDLARRADARAQEEHDLRMQQMKIQEETDPHKQLGASSIARQGIDLTNWLMQERRDWNSRLPAPQRADQYTVNEEVIDSIARSNAAHGDVFSLLPAMETVSDAVKPDWAHLSVAEYVESLYAIAKYANFMAPARATLQLDPAQH